MDDLGRNVEKWPLSRLRPFERNPREHPKVQIEQIARSMDEFGWTFPLLVDEAGMILAGVGRYMAAKLRGIADAPVIVARGWSEAQKRTYIIADNKLSENSRWDDALLSLELDDLMELGVDPALMGLDDGELKRLGGEADNGGGRMTVHEIATGTVRDEFWLSVRGPLAQQADALARLEAVMKELPGVKVELGTTKLDAEDQTWG